MITELSDEATEYGRHALHAFEVAGGDDLALRVFAAPDDRAALIAPVLDELGAWELDPRRDAGEAEAAAALCRSAGYWAVPYPVAERLARPVDVECDGMVVVDRASPSAPLAGLTLRWVAVDVDGRRSTVTPRLDATNARKDLLVVPIDLAPLDDDGALDLILGLVLPCWTLLGLLDRAMALTRSYILEREQFGQPLASFQGVQFQLTDAEVERVGLEELAKYALWSAATRRPEALDDALALRAAALEAADVVIHVAHQLHGAIGFCDETTLSWISRVSVPIRRLPFGMAATRAHLLDRAGRRGLTGLWS